ncbi:uncharacterized protein LOC124281863 [Haliotis rubra]|uniref:uncharacterized protein LOC124281863 n=1 Tax=Haliotis rubra TaxID=36100 RepID=UPI001EE5FE46|nr:uncharacterized protein LOC124281863 [Haliotis rubra]
MAIFHIKYPRRRGFLKWDELGCLARTLGTNSTKLALQTDSTKLALQNNPTKLTLQTNSTKLALQTSSTKPCFQVDLFESNVTDEITVEKDGILIKNVLLMLEYKLLEYLHQTINMHSAEWNMAVMRKVMLLLDHKALSFEELHDVRVAYQLYGAGDMKGMLLDKHTLLRCLKMCGRMIAPLKLMHRIKHMKEHFEETGRIQLAEFLDLILWCDLHSGFRHADMEYTEGKKNQLFKLVDFEKLLCHHDDRIAWVLNKKYLKDEWDFGHETLGSNRMFKEPPITNEARIQQTKFHKKSYCHLKNEVGRSQKRVYRAHAGYIRGRPITAPNLSMYGPKEEKQKAVETTAKEAYQTVRQRLRSAPSTARSTSLFADRPTTRQYQRLTTPRVVTRGDLSEVETKLNGLKFDMITMDSKYDIDKEEKMDHYLPGYREKLAQRPPQALSVPPPEPKPEPPKSTHWTEEVIEELVHPKLRLPPSHARKCDARYRGWQQVKTRRGSHFVLVSRCYDSSPKGNLFTKLQERTFTPVRHIHKDHLYRNTSIKQVQKGKGRLGEDRPVTAPAFLQRTRGRGAKEEQSENMEAESFHQQDPIPGDADREVAVAFCEDARQEDRMEVAERRNDKEPSLKGADFGYESFEEELQNNEPQVWGSQMKGAVVCDEGNMDSGLGEDVEVPVPHMEHSKPKIVEVGQIGTIALLEQIAESQDLEDMFSQTSRTRKTENHESDGPKSEERKSNPLSSPVSVKFNQVTEVPCTSSPDPELDGPGVATNGHTELEELNNDRTESTSMENRSESVSDGRTMNNQNEPTPNSRTSEQRRQSLTSECMESANQVQVRKDLKPRSASSVRSSNRSTSPSLKRCYSAGSQRRSSSLTGNSKHSRLVNRISDSISQDLRKRLLSAGHC